MTEAQRPPAGQTTARPALRPDWIALLSSLLLYGLACLLPALQLTPQADSIWPGFALLLMGWLGFFIFQFGWLANGPYFIGLLFLLLRKPLAALLSFGAALLVSLNTFLLFFQEIPANENTMHGYPLYALRPGFYLWLAAMLAGGVGAFILLLRRALPPRSTVK